VHVAVAAHSQLYRPCSVGSAATAQTTTSTQAGMYQSTLLSGEVQQQCTGCLPVVHGCQAVIALLPSSIPATVHKRRSDTAAALVGDLSCTSSQLPHTGRCTSNEPSFRSTAAGSNSPNLELYTKLRNRLCQEGCTHG
jgi:hypothetical protein